MGGVAVKGNFFVLNSVLDGVIICDVNGHILQHIDDRKGLQNNTVLGSFIDNQNNLWLGLDNGISFVNEGSPFTYFGFSYGLSTVYASAVHNGKLYVATNQGLFVHNWKTPFREESFTLVKGTTGQAWNIQSIDGQLFCAHNRGMMLIDGDHVSTVLDGNGYWGVKYVPDHPDILIGAHYNGFTVFEKRSGKWTFRNFIEGQTKSAASYEVEARYVWLKKDDWLYKMKLSNDLTKFLAIKNYHDVSATQKGIGSLQKLDNTIYVQTNNMFYTYARESDEFVKSAKMTALFEHLPKIRNAFQDRVGNIWYIFGESLGLLEKRENGSYQNVVAPFSNLTGNLVFDYVSVNAIDRENVFIGQTTGLAHYSPQLNRAKMEKPRAFLRSFTFPGDTILIGNGNRMTEIPSVPFQANRVQFSFSAPLYGNLDNVQFSYFLDGFDERWSNWSNRPLTEYTNLREGDYTMKVKVRNSYGVQSEPVSFTFSVAPPWYRHGLAYLLYLLAAIAAFIVIRARIQAKIRRDRYYETVEQRRLYLEREAKIKQEQYELEKEIERLKNEKLQIKILTKDKELVNNSLQVVKKNKILNGIIHRLKDIDTDAFDDQTKTQFSRLNRSISKEVNADKSWQDLEKHIRNVHFDFLKRLKEKHPTISPRELDLSTYLLMNMSTKEIAEIMNISSGGVELARYRLRKKLELNKKENLTGFLMTI